MTALSEILRQPSRDQHCIALCEGEDPRVIEAAAQVAQAGMARLILVGDERIIAPELAKHGQHPSNALQIKNPLRDHFDELATLFYDLRKHKGISEAQAAEAIKSAPNYAALLVKSGMAHGTVGGAVHTTGDIVRAALSIIGKAKTAKIVSSYFLMASDTINLFSDCGLVIDPSAEELAHIAISSAQSFRDITGQSANVAMLSFSTLGSAKHPKVDKVLEALQIAHTLDPECNISGELQFDAAFDRSVAAKKAASDPVAGRANVFIFPDLNAGNIGYKIAQRIGGMQAIGPVLQGLAMPANDLSRGCSTEDVVDMIGVTLRQAGA
ncbi:MAG: phosphate acetyltransferase [Gammaproteobacteria bacterium]|nr:phosphate acetyltransferase [Gammaproteobacteria bacterium]